MPITTHFASSNQLDTTVCDKVCQRIAAGQWFSPISSTNKTDRHDITVLLLKVVLVQYSSISVIGALNRLLDVMRYSFQWQVNDDHFSWYCDIFHKLIKFTDKIIMNKIMLKFWPNNRNIMSLNIGFSFRSEDVVSFFLR